MLRDVAVSCSLAQSDLVGHGEGGLGLTVDAFFETGSSSASPAGMPEVTNACPCAKSANETAPPQ